MLELVVLGVVLPVMVCAAFLVGAWQPWRGEAGPPRGGGGWGGALGFGAAFGMACWSVDAWSGLPPHETWHWIAYLAVAAAVVGVVDAMRRWPEAARWSIHLGLACASGWLLVGDWMEQPWLWRPVTAAVILLVYAVLDASAKRVGGASIPLCLCVAAIGASVVLVTLYNLKLAQLAGALAACLGLSALLAWWRPAFSLARGAVTVIAVVLPGLLLSGKYAAPGGTPGWTFVLAAVAPSALLIDRAPGVSGLGPRLAGAVRVAAVSIPVLVAVAGAIAAVA